MSETSEDEKLVVAFYQQQDENVPELRHLNIFSDGAASQFKQKYNLCNLTFFNETFGIDVAWHFFASGHGKGACDGIGATIKRSVWLRVKTGKFQVTNAEEFYNCALRIDSTVNVFFLCLFYPFAHNVKYFQRQLALKRTVFQSHC
jgi:hypothetical protein